MPLEVKLESYDRPDLVFSNPAISPGEVGVWMDKNVGLGCFVVARCMRPDIGVEIFIVEETREVESGAFIVPFTEADMLDIISAGLSWQRDIVDHEDEHLSITLQHTFPNGQINSLN